MIGNMNRSANRVGTQDTRRRFSLELGGGDSNDDGEVNPSATRTKESNAKSTAEKEAIMIPQPTRDIPANDKTQQHATSAPQRNLPEISYVPAAPPAVGAIPTTGHLPSKGLRNNALAQANGHARAAVTSLPETPSQPKVGVFASAGPLPRKGLRGHSNSTQDHGVGPGITSKQSRERPSGQTPITGCLPGATASTGPLPTKGLRGNGNSSQDHGVGPAISRKSGEISALGSPDVTQRSDVGETIPGQVHPPDSVPGVIVASIPRRQLGDLKAKAIESPTMPTKTPRLGSPYGQHNNFVDDINEGQEPMPESRPGVTAVDVPRRQLGDLKAKQTPPVIKSTIIPDFGPESHAHAGVPSLPPMPTATKPGAVTSAGSVPRKGLSGNSAQNERAMFPDRLTPALGPVDVVGNREPDIVLSSTAGTFDKSNSNSTPAPDEQDLSREGEMRRTKSLVEATLVTDDIDSENAKNLPTAEEVDKEKEERKVENRKKKRFPCWAKVFAVCVVMGILTVVIVMATSQDGGQALRQTQGGLSSNQELNPREVLPISEYVQSILPEFTLAELDLENEIDPSPQTLAFKWLMEDPNLEEYEDWRILQRYAMGTLYFSTGGPNWIENTDWLSHELHENEWYHNFVFDDFEFGGLPGDPIYYIRGGMMDEVRHIWLFNNDLEGTIPPELSLISSLVSVDFSTNKLGGSFPTELASLSNLAALLVGWNDLTGKIPGEFGSFPRLLWLSGHNNRLTGTIPSELGMGHFWNLQLTGNALTGVIPSELGLLSEMFWLFLDDCKLTGTIPSELGMMTSLQDLLMSGNELTGQIPSELANFGMANKKFANYIDELQRIFLPDSNLLRSFGNALEDAFESTNANAIHLHSNRLTGTIPTDLARLNFLNHDCISWLDGEDVLCNGLEFQDNFLTGTLPSLSPSLEYLDVSGNKLSGTISGDLGAGNLEHFDARGNRLSGSLPAGLQQWGAMKHFDVANNDMTGSIPVTLPPLFNLDITGNAMMAGIVSGDLCNQFKFNCSELLCGCDCDYCL